MWAALKGGKGAPAWATALSAAEAWGVPPWVIMSTPGSAKWIGRLDTFTRYRNKAQEQARKAYTNDED